MNTTAAADQAGVTVATIRAWCRRNVIAAVKTAGRWVIDTASLAHRITIGKMRTRTQEAAVLDLSALTITTRTRRGETITRITGYSTLLTAAITNPGDHAHATTALGRTTIVLSDTPDTDWDGEPGTRHAGTVRTSYRGGVPGISVDDVLDLAEQIRAQLSA